MLDLCILPAKLQRDFPPRRDPALFSFRRAAVMVILYPGLGRTSQTLMIKRAGHLALHPGEIAFPGGRFEKSDSGLSATARRETFEELGLDIPEARVIGRLPPVVTRTGIEITPFVALLDTTPVYRANADEVQEVLDIPLYDLLAAHPFPRRRGRMPLQENVYWFRGHRIWGASARILRVLAQLSRL